MASPPGVAVPPYSPPPHLHPGQRLTGGILPVLPPAATPSNVNSGQDHGGRAATRQGGPQHQYRGRHDAESSSGYPAVFPQLGLGQPGIDSLPPHALHGGVLGGSRGVCGAAPGAAAATDLSPARAMPSIRPAAVVGGHAAQALLHMMRPPLVPVQPRPHSQAAASDQPSPQRLPPPGATWSTSQPGLTLSTMPQHRIGPLDPAGYHPAGFTPPNSGGSTSATVPAGSVPQFGLPQPYGQPVQTAQHMMQRPAQQPPTQHGGWQPRPAVRNPAHPSPAWHAKPGLSQPAAAAGPRPQQQLPAVRPPQQVAASLASPQQWERQQAAAVAAPLKWPQTGHAGALSGGGFPQPGDSSNKQQQHGRQAGIVSTSLPATHTQAGGSITQRRPHDIKMAARANGIPALHQMQVTLPPSHATAGCMVPLYSRRLHRLHVSASLGVAKADEADTQQHPLCSQIHKQQSSFHRMHNHARADAQPQPLAQGPVACCCPVDGPR